MEYLESFPYRCGMEIFEFRTDVPIPSLNVHVNFIQCPSFPPWLKQDTAFSKLRMRWHSTRDYSCFACFIACFYFLVWLTAVSLCFMFLLIAPFSNSYFDVSIMLTLVISILNWQSSLHIFVSIWQFWGEHEHLLLRQTKGLSAFSLTWLH